MIRDGLSRRAVLDRLDAGPSRDAGPRPVMRVGCGHEPDVDDEPTGDLGEPQPSLLKRIDARTRSILASAAVAVVIVNAGAVWSYWHITGSGASAANAGTVVELNLGGRSDLNEPLAAGRTGDLVVTVINDNDFPIRITSVLPAPGNVVADPEHRDAGCVRTGVVFADAVDVQWNVGRNNVAAHTVPDGLTMTAASDPACAGAVFTVPVVVRAVAGVSSAR
jgi:hypothetical protein